MLRSTATFATLSATFATLSLQRLTARSDNAIIVFGGGVVASIDVMREREALVVKANELIQQSRFSLTARQQKIVLYLISKIKPEDEDFKRYLFSINDFCNVCGLDLSNGEHYADLKQAIKELSDKSIWVKMDDNRETLTRWISKAYIERNNGVIEIRLDEDLKPFLLNLKSNYTQYELFYALHFKSKYTIRLYELIQSIHYDELNEYSRTYKVEDLQALLDAEKYREYKNFKARVLAPAVQEINQYSEKNLSFSEIKRGRKVTNIELTISPKSTEEVIQIQAAIERDLDGVNGLDQLSIFDREEI